MLILPLFYKRQKMDTPYTDHSIEGVCGFSEEEMISNKTYPKRMQNNGH